MQYLISIAIGPVQEFIATARRSRDLWFGSWLLSELSKAAAKAVGKEKLIFPRITNDTDLEPYSDFNVVNKILAEVTEHPEIVGKKVEADIKQRLQEIQQGAFEKVAYPHFKKPIAEAQVANLVEVMWTAVEHERPEDYAKDRAKVERLLSARKATRDFTKITWGNNVPKSSLDGQRESVLEEKLYDDVASGKITKERLRVNYGVKEGERLCGVGLLKRHGNRSGDGSFFSTSHVASLPLLSQLKNEDAVTDYINEISALLTEIEETELYKILGKVPKGLEHPVFKRYDGHLLFSERLSEFFTDKGKLQKAREALNGVPEKDGTPAIKGFLEKAFGKNAKPLPYYALLFADGDNMGKAIETQDLKEKHQALSAKLSEFAGEVKTIIESENQGSLIYAGGDDVLAFVGLHKVLEYAEKLHTAFENKNIGGASLSIGIAVAHHLEPLEDALILVRRAEKAAKDITGKNALAVVVDKRSGASRIAKGTWGAIDERLNTFINWHYNNDLPDGAAYELRDLAIRLEIPQNEKPDSDLAIHLTEAKQKEAMRILGRKKKNSDESAIDKATLEKLKVYLDQIALTKKANEDNIAVLADELIIAKIFAEAKTLAEGKKDE